MKRFTLILLSICLSDFAMGQSLVYDDFESGILNPTHWTANQSANGVAAVRSNSQIAGIAAGGSYGLALGKSSDGGYETNSVDLKVNLQGYQQSQLLLRYLIIDFDEETNATSDGVFLSIDGGNTFFSQPIIGFTPNLWDEFYGRRVPYDLDALIRSSANIAATAPLPDSIVLRFQQRDDKDYYDQFGGGDDYDGIGLDNIQVFVEQPPSYAGLPYYEDFEMGSFGPEWQISSRWANASFNLNGLNRFNYIALQNATSWAKGNYSLVMGKFRDNEGNNLNAIDLHLDMGTYVDSQLLFNFITADFFDESSQYDAVYVGTHKDSVFHKIIDFEPSIWIQGDYGNWSQYYTYKAGTLDQPVPYDLDQLLTDKLGGVPDSLIIRFTQVGSGDLSTSSIEDGIFLDNIHIYVDREPTYVAAPYFEGFEDNILGPEWKIGSRAANDSLGINAMCRFENIQIQSATGWGVGSYSLRMIKTSDAEGANLNAIDLHLLMGTLVDSQLSLNFFAADFFDEAGPYDGIYASKGPGHPFQPIISFNSNQWDQPVYGSWDDYYWELNGYIGRRVPYDLDKLLIAKLGEVPDTLILRFQQYGNGDWGESGARDGIFLDNISIQVDPSPVYASLPYFDGFETAQFGKEWKINSAQAIGQTTLAGDTNQLTRFWAAQVYNLNGAPGGAYAMRMTKTSDHDGTNLNALDLHVNLAGESQVEMSYVMYEFFEDPQIDDGIWISVDGGLTFSKVHDFDLLATPNQTWTSQTVDLSAFAAAQSPPLILSDSTIIRFQQSGSGDLNTFGAEDGLAFDNISISCLPQEADFSFQVDCSTLEVDFTDASLGTNITTPYAWDFDGDGQIDTLGNGDISFQYASTGIYEVSLYVGNLDGCGDSITQQVFIGSSVPAPTINLTGPEVSLCDGDTIEAQAEVGYQAYLWSTSETTQQILITMPGTYSVRGMGIDGCFSTPTEFEVVSRPTPLEPFISLVGEPIICAGETTQVVAPFGASQYVWNTGDSTQSILVSETGLYEVSVVNSFGCASPPADTLITVLEIPETPSIIQQAGNDWLTSSETATTYQWYLDGNVLPEDSVSINAALYGVGNYTVQLANQDCQSELSAPFAFTLTSLAQLVPGGFSISPNPSSGKFRMMLDNQASTPDRIWVHNALGQLVLSISEFAPMPEQVIEIDLTAYPEGMYTICVATDQAMTSRKVLLRR